MAHTVSPEPGFPGQPRGSRRAPANGRGRGRHPGPKAQNCRARPQSLSPKASRSRPEASAGRTGSGVFTLGPAPATRTSGGPSAAARFPGSSGVSSAGYDGQEGQEGEEGPRGGEDGRQDGEEGVQALAEGGGERARASRPERRAPGAVAPRPGGARSPSDGCAPRAGAAPPGLTPFLRRGGGRPPGRLRGASGGSDPGIPPRARCPAGPLARLPCPALSPRPLLSPGWVCKWVSAELSAERSFCCPPLTVAYGLPRLGGSCSSMRVRGAPQPALPGRESSQASGLGSGGGPIRHLGNEKLRGHPAQGHTAEKWQELKLGPTPSMQRP